HHDTGSLHPGNLADLAILDRDIFTAPPEDIASARVERTYVGGRLVHSV
ncbi:amidohydrolase family protein, partial [Streptomyces sp. NPDC057496]